MIENGTVQHLPCGCKVWTLNGWYHRLDGPAIDRSTCKEGGLCKSLSSVYDQKEHYFIDGNQLSRWEHTKKIDSIKAEILRQITDKLIECYAWSYVHKSHSAEVTKSRLDSIWRDYYILGGRLPQPIWNAISDLFEELAKGNRND